MHDSKSAAARPRFALTPVASVACALLLAAGGRAQAQPLTLKPSPMLDEQIPAAARDQLPTFLSGDRITGRTEVETVIEGEAQLRRGATVIRADRLEYHQADDLARASGNVHINRAGDVFEGPLLELKVESFEGFFSQPRYRFLRNDAYGEAERVDFIDDKHAIIRKATYTTCQRRPGPSWMPDWILRASSLSIDQEEEVGVADGALLSFMGVPILPVPAISFPLSDKRKSGVLPPTIGLDNRNGLELTLPYYWNIAPNRDATLYPTLMSKRGVDLGGEFRYLERDYEGKVRGNFMPSDKLRESDRWGYSAQHSGLIGAGLPLARSA